MPVLREFFKYEGLGNDFVLLDERAPLVGDGARDGEPALPLAARVALCDRRRGVGGDGVVTLLPPTSGAAIARMHVTNADGSVPEMCGNAIRCVGLHLVRVGAAAADAPFLVDTDAGPKELVVARIAGGGAGGNADVSVDMGPARFTSPRQFPTLRGAPIAVGDFSARGTAVSMGNPHLVLDAAPDRVLAARIGPLLERDARFPERINVELARRAADGAIDVVVWERGVGLTDACGTGACAVAAAFVADGQAAAGRDVVVRLPGGALTICVPVDPGAGVRMTGPARLVFTGGVAVAG